MPSLDFPTTLGENDFLKSAGEVMQQLHATFMGSPF